MKQKIHYKMNKLLSENEEEARKIHPDGYSEVKREKSWDTWSHPKSRVFNKENGKKTKDTKKD